MQDPRPDPPRPGPVLWKRSTWEEIAELRHKGIDLATLPVGATKPHGPHLGLDVDTPSATLVAHAVSAAPGVPVLPALPSSCSLGHSRRWPGTLSLPGAGAS